MKKYFGLMLAAILICGASVFTSCTVSDNPASPAEPDLGVAEKIIGKWIKAERDGEPALTNEKDVFTFLSATKAYLSVSRVNYDETVPKWRAKEECDMTIDGNTVTLLSHSSNIDKVFTLNIKSIDDNNMSCNFKIVVMKDGEVYYTVEETRIYRRVTADYSTDIIGMWEGHSTGEEGSEFDDGENHRWEYMTDGSFNYFHKVDGQWQISDDDYAYYFVDGNLLCTRWKNAGAGNEEHRDWWEIESIENGVMKWKALRQKEDGTTYTATFEMKKVDVPTEAEVEQNIIGKWMLTKMNFQDIPTNGKFVYEFESLSKAYLSASLNAIPELPTIWNNKIELSVAIVDNHIALNGQMDEQTAFFDEFIIAEMSADRMECILIHSGINDKGEMTTSPALFCTFEKVDKDLSADIIGMWEGQVTSEQDTYGDGLQHRWEYKADGTYVYYVKDGENWVPSANTLNEYFVAGKLLCMRWINADQELREWWEIESIEDGVMKWKALRQNADGTTYTATFEMKKIDVSSEAEVNDLSDDIGFW